MAATIRCKSLVAAGVVLGAVIGAGLTTVLFEILRGVEEEGSLFGIPVPEITGLTQMVIAFITLMILIYRRDGILSWWELDGWMGKLGAKLSRAREEEHTPPDQPPAVKGGA